MVIVAKLTPHVSAQNGASDSNFGLTTMSDTTRFVRRCSITVWAFLWTGPSTDVRNSLQIVIHGILATRMHRELWNTFDHNQRPSDESVPLVIFPGSPPRHT